MGTFESTRWIWKDGEFVPWEDATLHVMSHVVHYGSSVFEGIRCYETVDGPAIFRLPEHLRRFRDSCRILRMRLDPSAEELTDACRALVGRNELDACYLRPIAVRGYGAAGVDGRASPVECYVICWPWGEYLGAGALENGVDVCVSSWNRPAPNTFPALAKAGGTYVNAQLIKMEALEAGFAEAIVLGTEGRISEGSGQNVFLVRDGTLLTPAVDGTMLAGITRDTVLRLAADLGIPAREQAIPREMLYIADEVFFSGTAAEITPVRSVDGIAVGSGGPGPLTRKLQVRFREVVHGEALRFRHWLTPVAEAASVDARAGEAAATETRAAS